MSFVYILLGIGAVYYMAIGIIYVFPTGSNNSSSGKTTDKVEANTTDSYTVNNDDDFGLFADNPSILVQKSDNKKVYLNNDTLIDTVQETSTEVKSVKIEPDETPINVLEKDDDSTKKSVSKDDVQIDETVDVEKGMHQESIVKSLRESIVNSDDTEGEEDEVDRIFREALEGVYNSENFKVNPIGLSFSQLDYDFEDLMNEKDFDAEVDELYVNEHDEFIGADSSEFIN